MGYLTIRNVSDTTILKLDEIAKKKGMSRQALIRNILDAFVLSSDIRTVENRYAELLNQIIPVLKENAKTLDEVKALIQNVEQGKLI